MLEVFCTPEFKRQMPLELQLVEQTRLIIGARIMQDKKMVLCIVLSMLITVSAISTSLGDAQSDCTLTITVSPLGAGVTNPSEGTHGYPVNTSVDVFRIHRPYSMLDHWELNGTGVGEGNEPYEPSITVLMNASYVLTCVYYLIEPFKAISITPLAAAVELGSSVNFVANVTGGLKPYSFQCMWTIHE